MNEPLTGEVETDPPLPDPQESTLGRVVFPEVSQRLVTITPQVAVEWLETTVQNRPLRTDFVNQLAGIIRRDEWQLNGETIKFDRFGHLIDGQHRLAACAAADLSITTLVVFGLEPETQTTVDVGRRRLLSDILALRGEVNTVALASTLNRLYAWELGETYLRSPHRAQLSPSQAISWLEQDSRVRDAVRVGLDVRGKSHGLVPATIASTTHYRFSQLDAADAHDFWLRVATGFDQDGEGMPREHPCMQLRAVFLRARDVRRHRQASMYVMLALSVKAWNYYRRGEIPHNLRFRAGGHSPETFPTPE